MTSSSEVKNQILLAISKYENDPSIPVINHIESSFDTKSVDWIEIANTLIELGYEDDIFGCYKNALKLQTSNETVDHEAWGYYFWDKKLYAQAEEIFSSIGFMSDKLVELQIIQNKPKESILLALEKALHDDFEFLPDSAVMLNIKKISNNYQGNQISNLSHLAQLYLFDENYPKAFELWSRDLKKRPNKADQILNDASFCLNWYSRDYRNIPIKNLLPS